MPPADTRSGSRRPKHLFEDVTSLAFVLALIVLILGGLATAGVKGDALFVGWWSGFARFRVVVTGVVILLLVLASLALWRVKAARPAVHARIEEDARPRQGLVVFLSEPKPVPVLVDDTHVVLGSARIERGSIDDALRGLAESGVQWNWEQFLRGLRPHVNSAKAVYLIGTGGDKGSFAHTEPARRLVGFFLRARVRVGPALEDPLSFQHTLAALMLGIEWLRSIGIPQSQIAVDVTGGPKIVSIAGAAATLNTSAVIQYVNTGIAPEGEAHIIRHYDLHSPPELNR